MTPLISVVLPTYNMASTIETAVKSYLAQNYDNSELIVVDDGSTDNTEELINTLKNTDQRIKYYKKQNGGRASAINLGAKKAEGKFLTLLDADDYLLEDSLEKRVNAFDSNTEAVVANTQILNEQKQIVSVKKPRKDVDLLDQVLFSPTTPFSNVSVVIKKESFEKIGGINEKYKRQQDIDFTLNLLKNCEVKYIDEEVYAYFSATHNRTKRIKHRLLSFKNRFKIINEHISGSKRVKAQIYNTAITTAKLIYDAFFCTKINCISDLFYAKETELANGKKLKVYKLKTLSNDASELWNKDNVELDAIGKPKLDHYYLKHGKFLRKYWIDELPQLYNLVKGDLKLVGFRPLSKESIKKFPLEHQELIKKQKPGLIAISYTLSKQKSMADLIKYEQKYAADYENNPIITDTKYFIKFLYITLVNGVRSE